MLLDVIRSIYQYNAWANHRILIATSELTREQFLAAIGASYPSVRDTLVHTMSAEWIWLSRWKGTSPSAMFEAIDFPNLQSIQKRWEPIEAETWQFVGDKGSVFLPLDFAVQLSGVTHPTGRKVLWTCIYS